MRDFPLEKCKDKLTMSNISQSVPVPFLKTSSGLRGMMVQREKTKGCTYFM